MSLFELIFLMFAYRCIVHVGTDCTMNAFCLQSSCYCIVMQLIEV